MDLCFIIKSKNEGNIWVPTWSLEIKTKGVNMISMRMIFQKNMNYFNYS